jgi:signal transduction histidine kinase
MAHFCLRRTGQRARRVRCQVMPVRHLFRSVWARVVALVLVVLVPALVLEVRSSLDDRDQLIEEAGARADELARTGAQGMTDLFDQTELLLTAIGNLTDVEGTGCGRDLGAAVESGSPPYEGMYAIAPAGNVVCGSDGAPRGPVGDEDWFRDTVARRTFTVTSTESELFAGSPVVVASLPLYDASGLNAVVATAINPTAFTAFTATADLPADTAVAVVDDEGTIVERQPDGDLYRGMQAPVVPPSEGDEPVEGEGVDGVRRLYAGEPVEAGDTTFSMIVGLSPDVAFTPADERLLSSLLVLAGVGVVVTVAALAIAQAGIVRPLQRLRRSMQAFAGGHDEERVGALRGPTEVTELGETFDAMADELGRRFDRLQGLVVQVEETAEEERTRIAAGIHDETLQTLAALRIQLQLLRRRSADAESVQALTTALAQADRTASELRNLLFDLNPPALSELGLGPALREIMEVKFGTSGPHTEVRDASDGAAPDWAEVLLFRIAQEGIANVAAHAGADHVTLDVTVDDGRATLRLADDGRGFDVAAAEATPVPGHIGLRVMRDRARAAGGDVLIESAVGRGTTVTAWVPTSRRLPATTAP